MHTTVAAVGGVRAQGGVASVFGDFSVALGAWAGIQELLDVDGAH